MDRPKVVVGIIIVNQEGKILLGNSPKWSDRWTIFGGHVEGGERLEEAAKREAWEETGLRVDEVHGLGFGECIDDPLFHKPGKHFVFIDYWGTTKDKDVKHNDEFSRTRWCTPEEALALDLVIYSRQAIQKYARQL